MLPILVSCLLLQTSGPAPLAEPPAAVVLQTAPPNLSAVPIVFEENQGQASAEFDFLGRVPGGAVMVSRTALAFTPALEFDTTGGAPLVRLNLVGASGVFDPVAEAPTNLRVSRFQGSQSCAWIQRAPTFARVRIPEVWPGVDALVTAEGRSARYDFELAPGANPALVRLAFEGIEDAWIDTDGALVLTATWGSWRHAAPYVYQQGVDGPEVIESAFTLEGELSSERRVGFRLGPYDPTRTLVIDPTLTYHNLFGNQSYDRAVDVVPDGNGGWWMVGTTGSLPFPYSSNQTNIGPLALGDVFVLHVDAANSFDEVILIGGSGSDSGVSIAVDTGTLYVAGNSSSIDFPVTVGAFQTTHLGNGDAFVLKFDVGTQSLIYSTYYGGSGFETLYGFAVDASAEPVLVGETASANLPLMGPLGGLDGVTDAFAVRLQADASDVVWSGYLGGVNRDTANAVALDVNSAAFIGGEFDALKSDSTAFVQEIAADGTLGPQVLYGGSGNDEVNDLIAYDTGDFTLWGTTNSPDLTLVSPLQAQLAGAYDAFLVVHDDLAGVVLATYLGGADIDLAVAIDEDPVTSNYLLSMNTESDDLPLIQPLSPWPSARDDAYLALLGTGQLVWATYLPGGDNENVLGVAINTNGRIAVVGSVDNLEDEPDQPPFFGGGFYTGINNSNAVFELIDPQITNGTARISFGQTLGTAFFDQPYEFFVYRLGANAGAASVEWIVYANTLFYPNLSGTIDFADGEQVGRAVVTFPSGSNGPGSTPTLVLQNPIAAVITGMGSRMVTLNTSTGGGGGGGSGSGSSSSSGPCIASSLLPQMDARGDLDGLRHFRDRALLPNAPGRALVRFHYRLSESLVPWFSQHPAAASVARGLLVSIVLASMHPGVAGLLLVLGVLGAKRARRWIAAQPVWASPAFVRSSAAQDCAVLG